MRSGLQPEALPTELQGRNVRAHQDKGGRQARTQFWRRDRDLNPGHLAVLQFSRLLASAARAPRHVQLLH